MSIEGKLLEQIKSVVRDIISMQISPYLAMERHYSQDLLQEVLV